MKPIAPMSKSDRLKRKLKQLRETRETAHKKAGPPENCISLSMCQYLGSMPSEWNYLPGQGWWHNSEADWVNSEFRMCIVDGLVYRAKDMLRTSDGSWIARKHLGNGWEVCQESNRVCPTAELVEVYDSNYKKRMVRKNYIADTEYYRRCDYSGKFFQHSCMVKLANPIGDDLQWVSLPVAVTNPEVFAQCNSCGNYAERIKIVPRVELGGEKCCNHCYTEKVLKAIIHKHDYTGYPQKLSSNPTVKLLVKGKLTEVPDESHRLYGVECEVEIQDSSKMTRWDLASAATAALGKDFIVHKNDGSLKNHPRESPLWGFEMVSAPCDMATHRERWPKLEHMEGFKMLRAWDTITCGMHVHVGKASLTTLQVGRVLVFITNPANRKFIETVAGRNSEAASRFVDKGYGDADKPDPDKYCAVNIRPKNTIEFRIFRGTIHPQHILRNIEFCDAVCTFCHPASRSLQDVKSYKSLINFVRSHRKDYPEFSRWLELKKFIPATRVAPGQTKPEVAEGELVETKSMGKWY